MRYIPHTPAEIARMLGTIGVRSVEELLPSLPDEVTAGARPSIPAALSELELVRRMGGLAARNANECTHSSFLGGGAYRHFIPSAVNHMLLRSEFYTSYTPYQPEVSQGTLQAIFEYQTLICQLTGMEVANASLYDGASAAAEAVWMGVRGTGRRKVLVSEGLHPQWAETIATYLGQEGGQIVIAPLGPDGTTDPACFAQVAAEELAAVVVQSPNFFGCIETLPRLFEPAHAAGALAIAAVAEPVSLGILRPPGELGADIVVGEGQGFGIPMSFGGPYLGIFATREKLMRQMPGRLVGETKDAKGRRGFVLTLSTREQHIRREKATSNVCTNEGLCALAATIFLALVGRRGLAALARRNLSLATYAKRRIAEERVGELRYGAPTFNEFAVWTRRPAAEVLAGLEDRGLLGGVNLGTFDGKRANEFLVCVTECNTAVEIENLVAGLKGFV